jgi:hypothetical protein
MNKYIKLATYVALGGAVIFGAWLLKKNYYDTGFTSKRQERRYFETYVLMQRGLAITPENRRLLKNMTLEELMKEVGIYKDKDGNYIDIDDMAGG